MLAADVRGFGARSNRSTGSGGGACGATTFATAFPPSSFGMGKASGAFGFAGVSIFAAGRSTGAAGGTGGAFTATAG
jgi:hypothetical protein